MKNKLRYIATFSAAFLTVVAIHAQSPADSTSTKSKRAIRKAEAQADTTAARKKPELKEYSELYLDTVKISKVFSINDYTMVGVEYGAEACMTMFNPSKNTQYFLQPNVCGVYIMKYGKLFNYLPYFGFKFGARFSHEGYKFKEDKETKITPTLEGATQAVMDFVEVPFMAHLHMDTQHLTFMADVGIYGGYRLNIARTGDNVSDDIRNGFLDTDNRFDYGLTGGVGFGVVFDPIEFHVNAQVRYAWGSLYQPDYYSKDYYRFAYPFDVMVTAGLYYHITRRTGKTKPQLRHEAYDRVYHPEKYEKTDSQSR